MLMTVSEILKIMLRDERLESDVDIKALAKRTQSFSGSDLKRELYSSGLCEFVV